MSKINFQFSQSIDMFKNVILEQSSYAKKEKKTSQIFHSVRFLFMVTKPTQNHFWHPLPTKERYSKYNFTFTFKIFPVSECYERREILCWRIWLWGFLWLVPQPVGVLQAVKTGIVWQLKHIFQRGIVLKKILSSAWLLHKRVASFLKVCPLLWPLFIVPLK